MKSPSSLIEAGLRVMKSADPVEKMKLTSSVFNRWKCQNIPLGDLTDIGTLPEYPALPPLPKIVPLNQVPPMSKAKCSPSLYILLSIAHIELNAVHCYWDTLLRASSMDDYPEDMPALFYEELFTVINDEARHFTLVSERLDQLNSKYGDIDAHGNLWDLAMITKSDLMARIAILPLVQEARGLDAGPRFVQKLKTENDRESADLVQLIVDEEEAHVAFGMKWFSYLCERKGVDRTETFHEKVKTYHPQKGLIPPFNEEARERAGFTPEFYKPLSIKQK